MFSGYDSNAKQMLTGNLMLIICSLFYLAWWIIAFRPEGAVKGFKSIWLLIPAFIFGLLSVINIAEGSNVAGLFSRKMVLIAGIIVYLALLLATEIILKRQVTTELLLIVGWTVLMFIELNALYGLDLFTKPQTIALLIVTAIFAVISMGCYLIYYNLDGAKGFIDGMIPLILVALMMTVVSLSA